MTVVTLPIAERELLSEVFGKLRAMKKDGTYTLEELENVMDPLDQIDKEYQKTLMSGVLPELDDVYTFAFRMCFSLAQMDEDLHPIYNKLCAVKSRLLVLKRQGAYLPVDIRILQEELAKVDALYKDGVITTNFNNKPIMPDGSIPAGQAMLSSMLHACHRLATNLLESTEVDARLEKKERECSDVFKAAEVLAKKARGDIVTVDEIMELQEKIRSVDTRVDGAFVLEDGSVPAGQAALASLLETAYSAANDLMAVRESERSIVSPEIKPLFDELQDIMDSLVGLKARSFNISSSDLAALQERLRTVEGKRDEGVFRNTPRTAGTNDIPEGQACLHYMLARCYGLVHELQAYTEPLAYYDDTFAMDVKLLSIRGKLRFFKNNPQSCTIAGLQLTEKDLENVLQQLTNNDLMEGAGLTKPKEDSDSAPLRSYLLDECFNLLYECISRMPEYVK